MARNNFAARLAVLCAFIPITALASQAQARPSSAAPSRAESFDIGTSGSACEAQGVSMGGTRRSIYDRKWVILCSDVARPVGTVYALRDATDAAARTATAREEPLDCAGEETVALDQTGAGAAALRHCRGSRTGLGWLVYETRRDSTLYSVEGLAGYDSALRLALANVVTDTIVPGEVPIANLGTTDRVSIIKARASVTDIDTLLGQGYRGNSAGSYANAAEIFAAAPALLRSDPGLTATERVLREHELTINRALQLSNLGAFDQAARLFAEARTMAGPDPVQSRLARNYEAIDAINRGNLETGIEILDRKVPDIAPAPAREGVALAIDAAMAAGLNGSGSSALTGVLGQDTRLTPQERALILDAQALQLRGIAQRLQGNNDAAIRSLSEAYRRAVNVREGRVTSITRLRSQILAELALGDEAQGRLDRAEALLRVSLRLLESQYPDSASLNVGRAQLAGFLARRGEPAEALGLYRSIIDSLEANRESLVGMQNLMEPYFNLLTASGRSDAAMTAELFRASQFVARPGAADTLTQLSRQLEGGSDEAAATFRRSLSLTRELERNRIEIARLNAVAEAGGAPEGLEELKQKQDRLLTEQLEVLNALANYPQYRAVANRTITLADLQDTLAPGEAYLKLVEVAGSAYSVFVTPDSAQSWRVALSTQDIADLVAALRGSISITVNGVQSTFPFDVDSALRLTDALTGPIADELASVRHLAFEPDGAMLTLPLNLLTSDRQGIANYHARVKRGGDEFDFTGIDWLGRDRYVSTALSAASFSDARKAPASKAAESYLGLGQNQPIDRQPALLHASHTDPGRMDADCNWPGSTWNRPVSAAELRSASAVFGSGRSDLMTGASFTDAAVMGRTDLDNFRILHFATHGLVTPPSPGCPARPALLTSFGGPDSDGLLSFREIFDLRLDADLVILSACDTASQASLTATREAGVTSGGDQALDGLVRAFIAAGGRQVIASHWPAPDDYDATQRLFTDFYGNAGATLGDALRQAQIGLMDDRETSHPFYWAGFAIVGDASRTLTGRQGR